MPSSRVFWAVGAASLMVAIAVTGIAYLSGAPFTEVTIDAAPPPYRGGLAAVPYECTYHVLDPAKVVCLRRDPIRPMDLTAGAVAGMAVLFALSIRWVRNALQALLRRRLLVGALTAAFLVGAAAAAWHYVPRALVREWLPPVDVEIARGYYRDYHRVHPPGCASVGEPSTYQCEAVFGDTLGIEELQIALAAGLVTFFLIAASTAAVRVLADGSQRPANPNVS